MEVHGFPPGVRFLPTPNECIYYLTRKVTSQPLHCNGLFLDLDLYDPRQLPEILFSAERKGELYLFTKLRRKGISGTTNAKRKVGKATWHGDQKLDDIYDDQGTVVGQFRKFSYREIGSQFDHRFLMTEYILPKGTSLQYDPLKDYVLCHIVKNPRWYNGKRVRISKRTTSTNRQAAAAVFEQPEMDVDAATGAVGNLMSSDVGSPSTSSCHTYQAETPSYIQPFDAPSAAVTHQVVIFEQTEPNVALVTAATEQIAASAFGDPSTSSYHSHQVETPSLFQPFGTPFNAPQYEKDYFGEYLMLMDYETENPSMESIWDQCYQPQ